MSLTESLSSIPVRELNLRKLIPVEPGDTIRSAVKAMRKAKLGCVIAVDGDGKPVGMLTEGMLRQLIPNNPTVIDETIESHMANKFPWVTLDDTIDMVLDAMQINNTRFICVVDDDGKAHALTGQKGLMEFVAEQFPRQVMVQRVGGTQHTDSREGA